jgi:hypothetical protein
MQRSQSISVLMKAGGYTHIQIMCCHVVQKPLATLPASKLDLSVDEIASSFVCRACGKSASPARVGLWKHGMKRVG